MKYLKYFKTRTECNAWKNSSDYVLPNVNYTVEDQAINYNAYVIEQIIMQVGNKYPDVATRLVALANKYTQSSINNFTNEVLNDPNTPEYVKNWDMSSAVGDVNINRNDFDGYTITFNMSLSGFDPSYDWNNPDWDDPTTKEKYFDLSQEKSLTLGSEDCDFIKSLHVDTEERGLSWLVIFNEMSDENGVPNQGTLNNIYNIEIEMYYEPSDYYSQYYLNINNNYELCEKAVPV